MQTIVNNSNKLMDALRNTNYRIIWIEHNSDGYDVDEFPRRSGRILGESAADVYGTSLRIHSTLKFNLSTQLSDLKLQYVNTPIMDTAQMSHSTITNVWFQGAPFVDGHGQDWSTITPNAIGTGITDSLMDGDN